MSIVTPSWRPKKRNVRYTERPEWVPDWVYTEALAAKRFYNEDWEFWVWRESINHNCSQAEAEDACIRGLKKALDRINFVYSSLFGYQMGSKIAKWYEEFLDMGDLFRKVNHLTYEKKLEPIVEKLIIEE